MTGQPGTYSLTASSSGLTSASSTTFTLGTALGTPFFTSSFTGNATNGQTTSISATASGTPNPTITVTSVLPTGVSFSGGSNGAGTLTIGSTAAVGTYTVNYSATNSVSTATQVFTLNVVASGQPTSVVATASSTPDDATLTWVAPSGVVVSSYTITPNNTTTATVGTPIVSVSSGATSQTITGLTAGDSYTFTISAIVGGVAHSVTSNTIVPVAAAPTATATGNTSDTATGTTTASVGTSGSSGSITATATGQGTVTVATYSSNPAGAAFSPPSGTSSYDVAVSPGSVISTLSFEVCNDSSGIIYWYNPATATTVQVTPAPTLVGGTSNCYQANLSATSTPDISQLTGSIFFVEPAPVSTGGGGGGGTFPVSGGGRGVLAPTLQQIAFTSVAPTVAAVGETYNVAAVSSAGLSVNLSIDPLSTGICSISGTTVTFLTVGTCVIDASQPGANGVGAAVGISQSIVVVKGSQTLAFASTAPTGARVGQTYTVAATSSAGLGVSLSIDPSATSICTISGSTVTFVAAGTCVIDATQGGNANYNAANPTTQSVAVGAASTTAPPPPAPPGAPTPVRVVPRPPVAVVTLKTSQLVLAHKLIPVGLGCTKANCSGAISLSVVVPVSTKVGTKMVVKLVNEVLATGSYSLAKNRTGVFSLKVTALGATLLAHVGSGHAKSASLVVGVLHGGKTVAKTVPVI